MLKPTVHDREFDLVEAFQQGDTDAAAALHRLYANRILALIRQRLNPAFRQRLDAEDIAQSAFRSFFRVLSDDAERSTSEIDAVWGLLASIAVNKLRARVRFHLADKRSIHREQGFSSNIDSAAIPDAEAIFLDELEIVMRNHLNRHRQILEMLLSGQSPEEVASRCDCTVRTVNRVIERTVEQLKNRVDQ